MKHERCLPKGTCFRRQESADLLSHCQAAVGMKEEINAIAMLTKAIVLKEDYTEAYQLRAEVLWGMKQAKDAAEDIQKLLNLNPETNKPCC